MIGKTQPKTTYTFQKDTEHTELKSILYVIIAGCCWGIIGLFSRPLLTIGYSAIQVSLLRALFTALFLIIYTFAKDRSKFHVQFKDLWLFVGTGILSIAAFNVCYFISISLNSLSLAAILLYTAPSFVVIFSRMIFKEKITKSKLMALLLSFAGSFFAAGLIGSSVQTSLLGLLVGLGSGLGYALYSIFSKIALKKYNWLTVITYTFIFATISLLPLSHPSEIKGLFVTTPSYLITILALSLISTLLPFFLYTSALQNLEAGKASLFTFVEPLVATLVGVFLFGEDLTINIVIGISLIVVSLFITKTSTQA